MADLVEAVAAATSVDGRDVAIERKSSDRKRLDHFASDAASDEFDGEAKAAAAPDAAKRLARLLRIN